jgi:hypothetical protein
MAAVMQQLWLGSSSRRAVVASCFHTTESVLLHASVSPSSQVRLMPYSYGDCVAAWLHTLGWLNSDVRAVVAPRLVVSKQAGALDCR